MGRTGCEGCAALLNDSRITKEALHCSAQPEASAGLGELLLTHFPETAMELALGRTLMTEYNFFSLKERWGEERVREGEKEAKKRKEQRNLVTPLESAVNSDKKRPWSLV